MIKTFAYNAITGFTAAIPTTAAIYMSVPQEEDTLAFYSNALGVLGSACIGIRLSRIVAKSLNTDPLTGFGGIAAGVMTAIFPGQLAKISLIALITIGSSSCLFN